MDWDMVINCIERWLDGWQANLLSTCERIALINSMLSVIPVYYMLIFKMPINIINMIDKICRNFLWSGPIGNQGSCHLARWEMICKPKIGGLGIISLKIMKITLVIKWLWKLSIMPPCYGSQLYKTIVLGEGDHGSKAEHIHLLQV